MFLKQKRCGKIKGRGCADGRKQRLDEERKDAAAPTVALESLILSCIIDAKERRFVATADIPNAFMQANMDELVHVRFRGTMAELLAKLNPGLYRKFISMENGKVVLYAELRKALYGTLRAAMLFWEDLTAKLTAWGLTPNRYDRCVMNKIVNDKQLTVLWHVDDLKISHEEESVVLDMVDKLNSAYGKVAPIVATMGKKHPYLGMILDYTEEGFVKIDMQDYIRRMLLEAPDEMRQGTAATPAADHLFTVNDQCAKLDEKQAQLFHHITAKLLFLCKRGRPDIQTAVAFLSTRVKSPDTDDYKKLYRVLNYLNGTLKLVLKLSADEPLVIKWWIDGAFAVHHDMRSHTGGTMSLGVGAAYSSSTRQKLNTKSSTEAEIVGVDDVLGQVLWTQYFLREQGYTIGPAVVYQDNQSAILLEKNGIASSSKRTRHIQIRYYFVADKVKSGDVTLEYCPTEEMVGDFLTKPLQGAAFYKFRRAILGLPG